MQLFILSQDKKSLIPVKDKIFINRKNEIIHGKYLLGKYDSQEECMQVIFEITSSINKIHQFVDENENVIMAFASTSEIYKMPTQEEMKGGE